MIITRISQRAGAVALAAAAAAVLTSCAGTTNGAGTTGTATAGAGTTGTATAGAGTGGVFVTSGFPKDSATLAKLLVSGAVSTHTAHVTFSVTSQSATIRGAGDEILDNGKATAYSISESLGQIGTLKLITTSGKTYVMLPKSERTSSKPWALVSASSSNAVVQALAGSMQTTSSFNSGDAAVTFVAATEQLRYLGAEQVDGARVGHYRLQVDVSRLPASFAQKTTLLQAGLKVLPVELYVDEHGRARKVTEMITFHGVTANTLVTVGDFDAPVSISAPPPSQVSTK